LGGGEGGGGRGGVREVEVGRASTLHGEDGGVHGRAGDGRGRDEEWKRLWRWPRRGSRENRHACMPSSDSAMSQQDSPLAALDRLGWPGRSGGGQGRAVKGRTVCFCVRDRKKLRPETGPPRGRKKRETEI